MGIAFWFIAKDADGKLRRFAQTEFSRFHQGLDPLPKWVHVDANRYAYFVELVVELDEDRRVADASQYTAFKCRVGDGGLIDKEHADQKMRAASAFLTVPPARETGSNLIDAEARFGNRRFDQLNRWTLTADELSELRNILRRPSRAE